ncbi:hypothetical protein NPE20_18920 [Mucilaginibacter sp. JC4]|uniref:Uncharacterized protein n=1 Tax=Mucilaginibacter aquariorum TaxID=2967225 RepID=A0ABT1T601_9SPHI|nr:hypothetical protein [Mucilaginibacter aquariorum]
MFLSLTVDRSEYTYSKSYALIWVGTWLFILMLFLVRLIFNFSEADWWLILSTLMIATSLVIHIKRHLIPALNYKVAIEVKDECIINRGEKIDFIEIDHFVLYDSGVISVILNQADKRPKNLLKWLDYWFTILFYRSSVIIDTRDVKVKASVLFNTLVDRLDRPQLSVSL